jgi:lipopolysaccharide heptosyltransferase II
MNARTGAGIGEAWRRARRVLCVRLDSLGDVLMCTPAMRALRDALPGRRLTLLGSPGGAAAAPFVPEIDDVIHHAVPWMKDGAGTGEEPHRAAHQAAHQADLALVQTLAARAFDAAVIFTTYTQSALPAALLCHLAGIPLRLAHCRENPYRLLSDWVPEPEPASMVRHEVQRQLELVRRIGCSTSELGLSFVPRPADFVAARARLQAAGVAPERPWLLLHPGASAASRRYPSGHWAEAIRLLAERVDMPLVLSGSAQEIALVEDIRAGCGVPVRSLAGQLNLGELGAALRLAALAITNNSGPAHIAAAVGTPVVDLYALTNPQHTPWRVRSRVLFQDVPCRFCFKSTCPAGHQACLAGVAPQRVADAALDLLGLRHRTDDADPVREADGAVQRAAAPAAPPDLPAQAAVDAG